MGSAKYCTVSDVKGYAKITRAVADPVIESLFIPAASRRMERHCRQTFYQEPVSEQVVRALIGVDGFLRLWPPTPYLATLTALEYRDLAQNTAWQSADLTRATVENEPCGAYVLVFGNHGNYRSAGLQARITGTWGYATDELPDDLRQACIRLVHFYLHQPDAPFGKAGNTHTGQWEVPAAMPEDVVENLAPWVRPVP